MILLLGGTAEARALAEALHAERVPVLTSLAGRVAHPRLPAGETRVGGFGGAEGLVSWLRAHRVTAVLDATHPFAQRISQSAATACLVAGVPLLRLQRPGFRERPGDRWTWVADERAAAAAIPRLGSRVLLTTGRQGLPAFAPVAGVWFLVRCVQAPEPPLPADHLLILDRGPYTPAGELALVDAHRIDLVVTKDSGGAATEPKLAAARARGLPVIVVSRPPRPAGVETVAEVSAALGWARAHASASGSERGV